MKGPAGTDAGGDAATLHQALIDSLVGGGPIRSPQVEAAFRAVPRHLFVPDVPVERAYRNEFIAVKEDAGQMLSSSSQPGAMAMMLELLDLHPGQRVLEIGAATGYNAALLAHIVGQEGQVVTLDIDEDLVAQARAHLGEAGYGRVRVVCADGGFGYPDAAPYNRIILTVGADDLTAAWREQLAPGGRLLMPLGLTPLDVVTGAKSLIAFDRVADHLESVGINSILMVPLRGAFARAAAGIVPLGPEPGINLLASGVIEADRIYRALGGSQHDIPVGVQIAPFAAHALRLWVALHEPRFCDLYAVGAALEREMVPYLLPYPRPLVHTFGLAEGGTLCMLTGAAGQQRTAGWGGDSWWQPIDLTVRCYGPDLALAQRLSGHVLAYQAAGQPRIRAYAAGAGDIIDPGEKIIDLPSARLAVAW